MDTVAEFQAAPAAAASNGENDTVSVAAAFFDPSGPISERGDAFLDAGGMFTAR